MIGTWSRSYAFSELFDVSAAGKISAKAPRSHKQVGTETGETTDTHDLSNPLQIRSGLYVIRVWRNQRFIDYFGQTRVGMYRRIRTHVEHGKAIKILGVAHVGALESNQHITTLVQKYMQFRFMPVSPEHLLRLEKMFIYQYAREFGHGPLGNILNLEVGEADSADEIFAKNVLANGFSSLGKVRRRGDCFWDFRSTA
jgi:hypothetical protein